ncbi:MAG: hypothetical protein ACE5KX_00880 [Acidimicrobiia bacterium]
MSTEELVEAYVQGGITRRVFIRRLVLTGVSLSAAIAYSQILGPAALAGGPGGGDGYPAYPPGKPAYPPGQPAYPPGQPGNRPPSERPPSEPPGRPADRPP